MPPRGAGSGPRCAHWWLEDLRSTASFLGLGVLGPPVWPQDGDEDYLRSPGRKPRGTGPGTWGALHKLYTVLLWRPRAGLWRATSSPTCGVHFSTSSREGKEGSSPGFLHERIQLVLMKRLLCAGDPAGLWKYPKGNLTVFIGKWVATQRWAPISSEQTAGTCLFSPCPWWAHSRPSRNEPAGPQHKTNTPATWHGS